MKFGGLQKEHLATLSFSRLSTHFLGGPKGAKAWLRRCVRSEVVGHVYSFTPVGIAQQQRGYGTFSFSGTTVENINPDDVSLLTSEAPPFGNGESTFSAASVYSSAENSGGNVPTREERARAVSAGVTPSVFTDVTEMDRYSRARVNSFIKRYDKSAQGNEPIFVVQILSTSGVASNTDEIASEDGISYHCAVRVPLPNPFHDSSTTQELWAHGVAGTAKEAEVCAAMHAERMIDFLGYHIYTLSSMQRKHAVAARKAGRHAPSPDDVVLPEAPALETFPLPIRCQGANDETESGQWQLLEERHQRFLSPPHALLIPCVLDPASQTRIQDLLRMNNFSFRQLCITKQDKARGGEEQQQAAYFMAQLTLPGALVGKGKRIVAKGKALSHDEAEVLACMHAELLLDQIGVSIFPMDERAQKGHAITAWQLGRPAPMPNETVPHEAVTTTTTTTTLPLPLKLLPSSLKSKARRYAPYSADETLVGKHVLLGQQPTDFLDTSVRETSAMNDLRAFLKVQHDPRAEQPFFCERVANFVRATVVLPLPTPCGLRGGIGIAANAEDAQTLAAMHALDVLTHLGIPVKSDEEEQLAWTTVRRERIGAPRFEANATNSRAVASLPSPPSRRQSQKNFTGFMNTNELVKEAAAQPPSAHSSETPIGAMPVKEASEDVVVVAAAAAATSTSVPTKKRRVKRASLGHQKQETSRSSPPPLASPSPAKTDFAQKPNGPTSRARTLTADTPDGFLLVSFEKKTLPQDALAIRSPRVVDPQARERLREYLSYTGRRFEDVFLKHLKDGSAEDGAPMHICTAQLPVPSRLGDRVAVGEAPTGNEAEQLAAMHAELILDTLGVCLFADPEKQRLHAEACAQYGRWAPKDNEDDSFATATTDTKCPPPLRKAPPPPLPLQSTSTPITVTKVPRPAARRVKRVSTDRAAESNVMDASEQALAPASSLSDTPELEKATDDSRLYTNILEQELDLVSKMRVQYYLRRQKVKVDVACEIFLLRGTMYHTAKMQLPLPATVTTDKNGDRETVEACGVAMTKRDAETLCWMHAERLLDAAAVPIFDNLPEFQRYHLTRVQRLGRSAPSSVNVSSAPTAKRGRLPSVLPLRLVVSNAVKVEKPEAPRGDNIDDASWAAYTEACSRYVLSKRIEVSNSYFDIERSPRTGVAVVDEALDEAEGLTAAEEEDAKLMLQLYCNAAGSLYPNFWRSHLVGPLTHRVHYTTTVVPGFEHVFAYGVGGTKERSQRRAALHALAVLKRVDPDYASYYGEAAAKKASPKTSLAQNDDEAASEDGAPALDLNEKPKFTAQGRRKAKSYVEPAWDEVKKDFTAQAKVRLIELFTISADSEPPTVRDTVQRNPNTPTKVLYSTEVTIVDDQGNRWSSKCDGAGPLCNRMEAYERLFLLLRHNVPLFGKLTEYIKSHPFFNPRHVAALSLSPAMREELASIMEAATALQQQQEQQQKQQELVMEGDKATVEGGTNASDDTHAEMDAVPGGDEDAAEQLQLLAVDASERAQRSRELVERLHEKITNTTYLENFAKKRQQLSIAAHRKEIVDAIAQNEVVVICGTTGCGKTTQIPQYILDEFTENGKGGDCRILVTQPRRLSAVSIAKRVADERLEPLGESCGYSIRFDTRPGKHINFCTSGILLRMLRLSPQLDNITHLIIDEIHERDINSDFLLILLRNLLKTRRDMRVILMSATLQADQFGAFFGGAPVINVEGYVYPVKEYFLEDLAGMAEEKQVTTTWLREAVRVTDAQEEREGSTSVDDWLAKDFLNLNPNKNQKYAVKETQNEIDYATVLFAIEQAPHLVDLQTSSILVFLPGWEEIIRTKEMLERNSRYHIICLHSSVGPEEQMQCFFPAPEGKIKVVLSTNIAESGVTIDDVGAVVDVGRAKEKSYIRRSSHTGVGQGEANHLSRLLTVYASRANCVQRRGRVGRTRPGVCLRLYTKKHFDELHEFQTPEMMRTPLDSLCLQILSLHLGDPVLFLQHALEPPKETDVRAALSRLTELGARTNEGALTPLGERLAVLPTEPQWGKMILMGAVFRCLDAALTIAATSSQVDVFQNNRDARDAARLHREDLSCQTQSDPIASLNGYNFWCAACAHKTPPEVARGIEERVLSVPQLMLVSRCKRQFFDLLCTSGFLPKYVARMYASRRHRRHGGDDLSEEGDVADAAPTDNEAEEEKAFVEVSTYSSESLSVPLVKTIIASGMLPHIALHHGKRMLRSKLEDFIAVSADSVLYRTPASEIGQPYYTYMELFLGTDTHRLSARGVSNMSLWTLLLLLRDADHTRIQHHAELGLAVIDEWLFFHLPLADLKCVESFKASFDTCLNHKFAHPHDVENNALLERMRKVIQTLASERIVPNHLVGEEGAWEEKGKILSPRNNLPDNIFLSKHTTRTKGDTAPNDRAKESGVDQTSVKEEA